MRRIHYNIRRACAITIGLVFFVAGMLKLMDPVGNILIVTEYYKYLHIPNALTPVAVTAIMASLAEAILGAALISGVARKITAVLSSSLLLLFTLLTLSMTITNPEMDCGCFGEAIHLTHAQTFSKNIVLCVLAAVAFIPLDDGFVSRKPKKWGFAIVVILVLSFVSYCHRNLPVMEFSAFKYGEQLMSDFSYGGKTATDGTVVLSFSDAYGEYCDELATEGKVLVFSVYDPEFMTDKDWSKVSRVVTDALNLGALPIILSTSRETVPLELSEYAYSADYKTLMTLNRSDGGVTYLYDGYIVDKWSSNCYPTYDQLVKDFNGEALEIAASHSVYGHMSFELLLLFSIGIMLLL